MTRVRCFQLQRTALVQVSLRRFTFGTDKRCRILAPGGHESNLVVVHRQAPAADWPAASGDPAFTGAPIASTDPRFPDECPYCGEPFQVDDERQVFVEDLWAGAPSGDLVTLRSAPAGAVWDASEWLTPAGPDGRSLVLALPDGIRWHIDGPPTTRAPGFRVANGQARGWTRSGDVATLTVEPSILTPTFHGVVRNGYLEELR